MSSAFHTIASSECQLGLEKVATHDTDESRPTPVRHFFHAIYQKQPAIYRGTHERREETRNSCPLLRAFSMNWDDVASLLNHCRHGHTTTGTSPPLLFQNGTAITNPHALYSSNPHAAYLDGCSIIINHADLHHPIIAQLCDNLQQTFPHVYANAYLTPASAHAVPAHADDRDVLVLQILGRKRWKVYSKVPVEYPFEKEQAGKNGNAIDSSVLQGGLCFNNKDVILSQGDVLYLPRGHVHEATTEDFNDEASGYEPSFHITVAIATHDWCLSVLLSETIRQTLDGVINFRMALPIGPCEEYGSVCAGESSSLTENPCLRQQLDEAMSIIQSKMTPALMEQRLLEKYRIHNAHANEHRQRISSVRQSTKRKSIDDGDECVGGTAASRLTLRTVIRVSTAEERSSVSIDDDHLRGLTVRGETMTILMNVLSKLKSDPDLNVAVKDLLDIATTGCVETDGTSLSMVCDFTLLSFARCCVELGALAVVWQ